jgi:anti-sigma factor RsiW
MTSSDAPSDSPLSEADIQAYADGTLSPERTAFLRDYLGKQPGEARRVAFYTRLNTQIQQAFQTPDESPGMNAQTSTHAFPAGHTTGRRQHGTPGAGRLGKTLIALILLVLTASGWLAATQVSPQSLNNAAVMALAESASSRYSAASPTRTDASAPDLSAIGLRLVDQRVLAPSPFQRAREYVYLNGDSQPVVVLSTLALLAPAQPQWAARRIGEIRLLTWTAQRQRYVVAGDARTHGLMRAADTMTMH